MIVGIPHVHAAPLVAPTSKGVFQVAMRDVDGPDAITLTFTPVSTKNSPVVFTSGLRPGPLHMATLFPRTMAAVQQRDHRGPGAAENSAAPRATNDLEHIADGWTELATRGVGPESNTPAYRAVDAGLDTDTACRWAGIVGPSMSATNLYRDIIDIHARNQLDPTTAREWVSLWNTDSAYGDLEALRNLAPTLKPFIAQGWKPIHYRAMQDILNKDMHEAVPAYWAAATPVRALVAAARKRNRQWMLKVTRAQLEVERVKAVFNHPHLEWHRF